MPKLERREAWRQEELRLLRELRRRCDAYFVFPDPRHRDDIQQTLTRLHEHDKAKP